MISDKNRKMKNSIIYGLILLITVNFSLSIVHRKSRVSPKTSGTNDIHYKTLYYKQKVDHFSYVNQDTYNQRYLVADQHWDPDVGPIFFYTGNEGDIAWFCNNTGLMWDWAPKFKALLVFAEHRYYGESMPYGKKSYDDLTKLGYQSSEQALADFAILIDHLKSSMPGAADKPVIAIGGSYGGMLSAWFRIKYPHVVVGALAASAPIWYFGDLTPCEAFFETVTNDFKRENPVCPQNIAKSWPVINELGKTAEGRRSLRSTFSLCKPLGEGQVNTLKEWLQSTYVNLAMVDYPYAASFLEPLPAWPIKAVCNYLSKPGMSSSELLMSVAQGMNLYYNYSGSASCLNIEQQATADLGDTGWEFQACTEMVMPFCTDGQNDMFEPKSWDIKKFSADCRKNWGTTPDGNWILQLYGGKNITAASNIIFSNGDLDPWSVGGVLSSLSESLVAIRIEGGAHHLDLRATSPYDPPSVTRARQQEMKIIRAWIEDYWKKESKDWQVWDWPGLYMYKSSIFGQDDPDLSVTTDSSIISDATVIMGTCMFILGAVIIFCYLDLAQRIQIRKVGKRAKVTKMTKVPVQYTNDIVDSSSEDCLLGNGKNKL